VSDAPRRRQDAPGVVSRLPVRLEGLAARLAGLFPVQLLGRPEVAFSSVEYDHRRLGAATRDDKGAGVLFCCLPGEKKDGHEFARAAVEAGAVAFLCERPLGEDGGGRPELVVGAGNGRQAMAEAACAVFGDPASKVATLGVTGTNGKTTTTHLLVAVLEEAGYLTRLVGTLSGARTTPEAPELQLELARAYEAGVQAGQPAAVALEVSSHALVQHRVDGYRHDVAVFTNLSQDHLDYHKTMEAYFAAKASLFTPERAACGVVNAGDAYGRRLLESAGIPVEAFSFEEADELDIGPTGSRFLLRGHEVTLSLLGALNVENALAAAAAARALGVSDSVIAAGLSRAEPVRGRFEQVENALGLAVVVDYAHTPAGLAQACSALRGLLSPPGRLLVVFGAGGERDHEKRPLMGQAVAEAADVAVVTSDNPRHEDPRSIIAEVLAGCRGPAELHVEADRRRAIGLALGLSGPSDVLLVAGKGHETTQQVGDELLSFDDRLVVEEEAERLAGAA
jgi:UDP-N-acetylmuramoyl-L-alanyl-D-glutamate--2,6-diaminopimelate ligase